MNYSKLGEYTHHCHLNYSWVAVWRCEGEKIILEINENEKVEKIKVDVEVEENESATESDWYKEAKTNWTPGTEIRAQRQKRGWTQKELGERLGVSKQVVSDLENNHRSVSIKRAKVLGNIFKRDYTKFL